MKKGFTSIICICVLLAAGLCLGDTGIILALNSDVSRLKKQLKIRGVSHFAKRQFYKGELNDQKVVVVRSPMGKVNNAVTTQFLISNFPITRIISFSPAGKLSSDLKIGDFVIGSKVFQHDFGTVKPYGFIWAPVPDGTGPSEPGYNYPDPGAIERCLGYAQNKSLGANQLIRGIVVSGDQFISSSAKRNWLFEKFGAVAVDMGGAAIGQVCFANDIPFCILRVITDDAGILARVDFGRSVDGYHSSINAEKLLKAVVLQTNLAENRINGRRP